MAPDQGKIGISRNPADVFAYVSDLTRHGEWQSTIICVHVADTEGPTRVGSKATDVRRIGRRKETITYEIAEHDPPTTLAFRGVDCPIRAIGRATIEPVRQWLTRHPRARCGEPLLLPFARKMSRREVPEDQQRLKERLESGAA